MQTADGSRLPDFIIIGAMKSGTTSIHHILASRDDLFMPDKEVYFFDVDDREQHGDFFIKTRDGWTDHDFDRDFDRYFDWYRRIFSRARPDQLIGEDTTTYLASKKAPARIAKVLPTVKLLAVLRDPISRAYSHYWHNLAAGRVTMSFDRTVRKQGGNLLARGYYAQQLQRYEKFLKAGRLKVVLFEDFIRDKQGTIDDICDYLRIPGTVDVSRVDAHRNVATVPLVIPLRFAANRVYQALASNRSNRNIPNMPAYDPARIGASVQGAPISSRIWEFYRNRLPSRKYPPMTPETRAFLEQHFREQNAGLADLIGRDVAERWPYMG